MSTHHQQRSRRHFRNILISPKNQLRVGLMVLGYGLVGIALMVGYVFVIYNNIIKSLMSVASVGPEVERVMQTAMTSTWVVLSLTTFSFAGLAFFMAIRVTHRFYGPLVPIRRHIEALKKGDYSVRSRLRKNDELKELMNDLNDLASALEERHSSQSIDNGESSIAG